MGRAITPPAAASRGRVLLIEDDTAVRHGIAGVLRVKGYAVVEAETFRHGLELLGTRPDVVISDLRLPDGDAVTFLPRLRAIDPSVPIYILTGFGTVDVAVRAVKLGVEDFFAKPVEIATLLERVESAVARRQSMITGKRRRVTLELQCLRSEAMKKLEDEVERLRDSSCTVLLLGETGTGKSVLARRIHDVGARRDGPFVDVNCAGLSRELFESELFGHERGAFTGAHTAKRGLFDEANDGTLFLDEIGGIDLQLQPRILKALEEKRFRRLGDVRERNADVRLIAATHHDLLPAVERKAFRADLFYRISTVTLRIPALRERIGDIPVLVDYMLAQEDAADVTLTRDAWEKLEAHAWPGNIRELKNVVHRALLLRQGRSITANEVRFDRDARPPARASVRPRADAFSGTLEEVEREHIARALEAANWRVSDAAIRLGIPRSTLYQKIKTYRIVRRVGGVDSN